MSARPLDLLVRRLRRLADRTDSAEPADADLLERYVRQADEAAFEAIVRRHGGLVLGVCRRVLGHEADAEDAFQATFFVLARKARTLRGSNTLAAWLHRVAHRAALEARAARARRAAREGPWVETPAPPAEDPVWRDLRPILDEEIGRLPDKYRVPFVLCHLEGKTNAEAAALLGCPHGTVLSRLARARERLRRRLIGRGVTVPAAGVAALLAAHTGADAASPALVDLTTRTVHAAISPAAASAAVALAEGVLRAMFLTKLKTVVLVGFAAVLTVGLVLGYHAWPAESSAAPPAPAAQRPAPPPNEAAPPAAPGEAKPAQQPAAAPGAEDPRDTAARVRTTRDNLKAISWALNTRKQFSPWVLPRPAITDTTGRPLLSWRVTILWWLGPAGQALASEFKYDEPWDSEHNKKLLAKMPAVYAAPGRERAETGLTYYQVFVGPGTAFDKSPRVPDAQEGDSGPSGLLGGPFPFTPGMAPPGTMPPGMAPPGTMPPGMAPPGIMPPGMVPPGGKPGPTKPLQIRVEGVALHDIKDGLANTIFVAEAGTPVPWTKPDDLLFAPDKPLPRLGGVFSGDFHVLMGDGSVRFLGRGTPADLIKAAITRAGGEAIDWSRATWPESADVPGAGQAVDELTREIAGMKELLEVRRKQTQAFRSQLEQVKEEYNRRYDMERLQQERQGLKEQLRKTEEEMELLRREVEAFKERLKR